MEHQLRKLLDTSDKDLYVYEGCTVIMVKDLLLDALNLIRKMLGVAQ